MTAIITGTGLGLQRSSANLLGARGQLGSAGLGRAAQGVTVNAATGGLVIQTQDEILTGRGPDATFASTYNSLGALNNNYTNLDGTADADGWLLNTQRKIVISGTGNTAGSTATLTDWDGTQAVFSYNTTSLRYESVEFPYNDDTLTWADGVFTYIEGQSRSVQTFASNIGGRLIEMRDADGNTVTYTYDLAGTAGKLARVATANSSGTQFNYVDLIYGANSNGNKTLTLATSYSDLSATPAINTTLSRVIYTYDSGTATARLSKVDVDLTPLNATDSVTYNITYTYKDASSRLITGISQSDGTNYSIAYDDSNRVQSLTQAMASGVNQVTTFAYDTANRVTTVTDALSNVYKMTYDTLGRLTRLEEPAPTGGTATVKTFLYETVNTDQLLITSRVFDNAVSENNPAVALETTSSLYDANFNLLEVVLGDNTAVKYTYGSFNQVLTETHYMGFDANGVADGVAPTGAMITQYIYDEAGNGVGDDGTAVDDLAEKHLRFTVSAEGRVTEFQYNGFGQLTATLSYTGSKYTGTTFTEAALNTWAGTANDLPVQRTDNVYDFRGNLLQSTSWSATDTNGAGVTTQDWSRVDYVYDMAGRLLSRKVSGTNALGGEATPVTEVFAYDGLGRVISSTDLLGQTTTVTINDLTRTTTITTPNDPTRTSVYNIGGTLQSDAFSSGGTALGTTTYAYDALGRLRMATDALGVNTYYTYDKQSRLTATIDGNGSMTEFKYDGADRVIATVTYANAVSAANLTTLGTVTTNTEVATVRPAVSTSDRWNWTIYNKAGRVIETIDGAGAAIKYDYDGAGRALSTFAYRTALAGSTVNGADGVSGYRTALPTTAVLPGTNIWEDRTSTNLYDNDGLLIGTVLQQAGSGNGKIVEYVYDSAGRLVDTVTYANTVTPVNWQGKTLAQIKAVLTLDATNDAHAYRLYDGRGRLGATIDGEGNVTRFHYTARGDLDQQIVGQKVTASTSYTLATLPAASGTLETTRWYRNAAGQVTSQVRTLSSGTETTAYTYDSRGRLLTQTVSETISAETRSQTFRYDAKGRLVGQLSGEGSAALAALGASPTQAQIDSIYATWGTTYSYDLADRLIAKVTPDGSGASGVKTLYYYDGDGALRFEINALGEVVEHQYNNLEDEVATIAYGTRIAAGTLATLTGGLVTATVTNAVAAIANAALDTKVQAGFDVRGLQSTSTDALGNVTTYTYNVFGQTATVTGPVLAGPNVSYWQQFGYYTDGRFWYSNHLINGLNSANLADGYSYDTPTVDGLMVQHTPNGNDSRTNRSYTDRAGRTVKQRDGFNVPSVIAYDPRSNVISSTDRTNKTTTFTYDLFNRNVTATTAEGITSSVKNNAYGQSILITDGKGNTKTYTYDKDGNLKTVADAAGTTTYSYDKADRLVDVVDAKGVGMHYTYDAVGRVLTEVRDYGSGKLNLTTTYAYDAKGQAISVTDALGTVTTYTYDLKGQKTRVVQDAGSGKLNITTDFVYRADGKIVSQTDAVGTAQARTTNFEYDTLGRMTKKVEDAGSGKLNVTTLYYYDLNSNLIATTDALGRTTRFVYDVNNRLALSIDAEGQVTQTFYDAEDRAIATRQSVGTLSAAQIAAMSDPAQANQWNEISNTGNDVTVVKKVKDVTTGAVTATNVATISANAADRINRSFYDGDGRAVYAVDAEGYVTQNVYDKANNVIQTIRYTLQTTTLTNTSTTANVAALFTTTLNNGALATNIPADAVVTTYTYDGANRLTDVTDGTGTVTHFVMDALGQITDTTVAYNTTDAVTTHRVFDNVGRVTQETRAYGASEATTTNYTYDNLGNVLSAVSAAGKPEASTTNFTYDALGRVLTQSVDVSKIGEAASFATTTFAYDARGNKVKVTDPRGNSGYFYFDNLDRLTLQVDPEGYVVKTEYAIGSIVAKVTRFASTANNLASVSASTLPLWTANNATDAVTQFTYDKLDRVKTAVDAEGFTESYSYDALGNRTSVTNKLGGVTNYGYDKRGFVVWERPEQVAYDYNGTVLASNVRTDYFYDSRGNLITKISSNNIAATALRTDYTYDKLDRLIQQTDPAFLGLTPVTTWQYDKRGNVRLQTAADGGKTYTYYDALNRKIGEVSPVGTLSEWAYDATGNMINQKIWATPVTLPTSIAAAQPAQSGAVRETRLGYDMNGRLIQTLVMGVRTGAFIGTSYVTDTGQNLQSNNEYDAFGNLIKEIDANRNAIYHWYDRNGREVAKLDQEGYLTTWTRDADGNVTTETRYATRFAGMPGTGAPTVAASSNDRTTTFTYDKMGRRLSEARNADQVASVSGNAVTTSSQTSSISYSYNALGEVLSKTEATGDKTDYQYDNQGRLIRQLDPLAQDFNSGGAGQVRHVTYYYYDANNNLVRSVEKAEAQGGGYATGYSAADDRINLFLYSGNKLHMVRDALGNDRHYSYDEMGRNTNEYYQRANSENVVDSANAYYEGNVTSYDLAGRIVLKRQVSCANFGDWVTRGPVTQFSYNAYGEVTQRALDGMVQEQMVYDQAGRVVKTNSGDGVWKVLVYDANGNTTLTLAALTRNMGADSVDSALAAFGAIDSSTDQTMTASITVYDKRNMASQTREPQRQIDQSANRYTITRNRAYNAFGELASETDARGNTTDYSYNTLGRVIRTVAPTVSITNEDGSSQYVRPTSDYYYDAAGRLVATRDANGSYAAGGTVGAGTAKAANTGNLTTRQLLAGSGYGGSEAKVLKEFRPDASVAESRYDAFGQLRQKIDGLGQMSQLQYDKGGHVIVEINPSGFAEHYTYDMLGQRVTHYNSMLTERTDYDIRGRVISTVDGMGHRVNYSYTWSNVATTGLTQSGSWIKTTTYVDAANRSMSEGTDEFGHVTTRTDLGGHVTSFGYNTAGQLITSTIGTQTTTFAYYNTGQLSSNNGANGLATYSYDADGNRLSEKLIKNSVVVKDASASYDAMGRLITWNQAASTTAPLASLVHKYDANGNILMTYQSYTSILYNGNAGYVISNSPATFRYDAMNRIVGENNANKLYDAAGQLVRETSSRYVTKKVLDPNWDGIDKAAMYIYISGNLQLWTNYNYNSDGTLASVTEQTEGYSQATDPDTFEVGLIPNGVMGAAKTRSVFTYDALGRVLTQSDYEQTGTAVVYSRSASYNAAGQITWESTSTKRADNSTYGLTNSYGYGTGASYALGSVVTISSTSTVNGGSSSTSSESIAYAWYDAAVQSQIDYTPNTSSPGTVYHSYVTINALGQQSGVSIQDGRPRTVSYVADENGQILRRDEVQTSSSVGPHEVWYRFGGKQMAFTGNNSETGKLAYGDSITQRTVTQGTGMFRDGQTYGSAVVDFTQTSDAINSYSQGSSYSSYTVRQGDSLQGIAQTVWGDASLWYKLAEANGLSGSAQLSEGQNLILPAGVRSVSHNAATFKPYNQAEALGDITPSAPKPPKKNNCGVFGQILLAVIAVAVTIVALPAAGPAAGWLGVGQGALAGLAGGAASQVVGVATGIQEKFSFAGLAMSAIGGAVSAGVGNILGSGAKLGSQFIGDVLRGTVSSVVTQGIGVATGLQDKFSWAGVAAAGVMGGVGGAIERGLSGNKGHYSKTGTEQHVDGTIYSVAKGSWVWNEGASASFGAQVMSGAASLLAGAATRSAIEGTDFGDNVMAMLPEAIGGVIGRALGGAVDRAFAGGQEQAAKSQGTGEQTKEVAQTVGQQVDEALVDRHQIVVTGRTRFNILSSDTFNFYQGLTASSDQMLSDISTFDLGDLGAIIRRGKVTLLEALAPVASKRAKVSTSNPSFRDNVLFNGGPEAGTTGNVAVVAELDEAIDYDRRSNTVGYRLLNADGKSTTWIVLEDRTRVLREGQFSLDVAAGSGLAVMFAPLIPVLAEGASSAWTYGLVNAGKITTATGIAGEVITGVPLTVPVSAGVGVAALGAAESAPEFVGPLIGKSGFRTSSEFAEAVGTRYQGFVDDAYIAGQRLESQGLLRGHPDFRLGNYVDRISQRDLSAYLRSEGISEGPGSLIQLNRYLRDPAGSGLYVRPDVRIPAAERIFDATVGFKTPGSTQLTGFSQYSGGNYITVTRPGPVGGSYSIVP